MIERLVLFGATGDLAGRFLLPALARLKATGDLPAGFRIVGASQENWDDDAFLDHVARRLEEHAADVPAAARAAVCRGLRHVPVDFAGPRTVARVLAAAGGDAPATADYEPVAAYLALPAGVFTAAVTALGVI